MLKPWDHQETHIRTGVACIQFILRMPQFRHTAAVPCHGHAKHLCEPQSATPTAKEVDFDAGALSAED